MKNKKRLFLTLIIAISIILAGFISSPFDLKILKSGNNIVTHHVLDSALIDYQNSEFNIIGKKFRYYNQNIEDSIIRQFIKVAEFYELDAYLDLYVSQICYESGAKHYKSNGQLVKSSADAIGFSQIIPSTAYYYLRNIFTNKDIMDIKRLGGTNVSFINKHPRYGCGQAASNEAKRWLSNPNNNIIMWGFIMRESLNECGDINSSFVCYNGGSGYLNSWVNSGKSPSQHPYVMKINSITRKLNNL